MLRSNILARTISSFGDFKLRNPLAVLQQHCFTLDRFNYHLRDCQLILSIVKSLIRFHIGTFTNPSTIIYLHPCYPPILENFKIKTNENSLLIRDTSEKSRYKLMVQVFYTNDLVCFKWQICWSSNNLEIVFSRLSKIAISCVVLSA